MGPHRNVSHTAILLKLSCDVLCSAVLAFLLYFIIGAVIMKFVRGASGMEIIPNYLIWKNFPFLVKVY